MKTADDRKEKMGKFVVGMGYMDSEQYASYIEKNPNSKAAQSAQEIGKKEFKHDTYKVPATDLASYYKWITPFIAFTFYFFLNAFSSIFKPS